MEQLGDSSGTIFSVLQMIEIQYLKVCHMIAVIVHIPGTWAEPANPAFDHE